MARPAQKTFVMEAIDPVTECVIHEVTFTVENLDKLVHILGCSYADIMNSHAFELTSEQITEISCLYKTEIESAGHTIILRPVNRFDLLPYKVHTNRELTMMLAGTKPLAYFSDVYPGSKYYKIPEYLFDPYVESGRLVKREYILRWSPQSDPGDGTHGMRVVLYALSHEEWRIDAFALAQATAEKVGWNEGFERLIGSLLGYEEWQTDAYISSLKNESL